MTPNRYPAPDRTFIIEIDGQEFQTSDPTLSREQLRAMAGRPLDYLVYRIQPTSEETLDASSVVDLRVPEVERFRTAPPTPASLPQPFKINVDGQRFESARSVVTGLDIKTIAGVAADFVLYLEGRAGADRLVADAENLDLNLPGTESFYTSPPATFGSGQ